MTAGHLLVVDDQPQNRLLLKTIFQDEYTVSVAFGGAEALDIIAQGEIDLVLLDLMMPDMTGLEMLEIVRADEATADLPVIMISAMSNNKNIIAGLRKGANDFVPRPFDVDVVKARVQTQVRLKRLADERKQLISELAAANETKNNLLRIASHDLKNPIQNLSLLHSLILEMTPDDTEIHEVLTIAQDSTNKMMHIVEEFLDLEILQGNEIQIELTTVNLEQCVYEALVQFTDAAAAKDITLNVGDVGAVVKADSRRLYQVISNLISNAIKYSPPHSAITIKACHSHDDVILSVIDEGPGISDEERTQLFKPFSKVSTLPTGGETKTGLGLWIVREMMNLQGGDVGMKPAENGGSHFWVSLPRSPETMVSA